MTSLQDSEPMRCSFCHKSLVQVKKLIAGPGVYICDECIELCNEILEEDLVPSDPSLRVCSFCGVSETDIEFFMKSRGTRSGPKLLMCSTCLMIGNRLLSEYLKVHEIDQNKEFLVCPYCRAAVDRQAHVCHQCRNPYFGYDLELLAEVFNKVPELAANPSIEIIKATISETFSDRSEIDPSKSFPSAEWIEHVD